jgi:hypothetical protein
MAKSLMGAVDGSNLARSMRHPYEALQGLNAAPLWRQCGVTAGQAKIERAMLYQRPDGGSGNGRRGLAASDWS